MSNSGSTDIGKSLAMMRKLLEQVVQTLVTKPESVRVAAGLQEDGAHKLTITVDNQDLGKVIGKNGQTIKAIRLLVNALKSDNYNIMVDVTA